MINCLVYLFQVGFQIIKFTFCFVRFGFLLYSLTPQGPLIPLFPSHTFASLFLFALIIILRFPSNCCQLHSLHFYIQGLLAPSSGRKRKATEHQREGARERKRSEKIKCSDMARPDMETPNSPVIEEICLDDSSDDETCKIQIW